MQNKKTEGVEFIGSFRQAGEPITQIGFTTNIPCHSQDS